MCDLGGVFVESALKSPDSGNIKPELFHSRVASGQIQPARHLLLALGLLCLYLSLSLLNSALLVALSRCSSSYAGEESTLGRRLHGACRRYRNTLQLPRRVTVTVHAAPTAVARCRSSTRA